MQRSRIFFSSSFLFFWEKAWHDNGLKSFVQKRLDFTSNLPTTIVVDLPQDSLFCGKTNFYSAKVLKSVGSQKDIAASEDFRNRHTSEKLQSLDCFFPEERIRKRRKYISTILCTSGKKFSASMIAS